MSGISVNAESWKNKNVSSLKVYFIIIEKFKNNKNAILRVIDKWICVILQAHRYSKL